MKIVRIQRWDILVLAFLLCSIPLSSGSARTASLTTTASSPVSVSHSTSSSSTKNPNVVVSLVNYVKDSITGTINGCGQLWTNYGTCKEIREKIKTHQDHLRERWVRQGLYEPNSKEMKRVLQQKIGGITFEEYSFLQKGKDDRSKVMSLAFLAFGAPRFLPYALMFQPDMLPRPLKPIRDEKTGETFLEKQSRERTAALLQMLLNLEKDAHVIPFGARLNIFGRKKQEEGLNNAQKINQQIQNFMENIGLQSREGVRELMQKLEPVLYSREDFPRAASRLSQVPMSITKGLGNALLGEGLLTNFSPGFLLRGRLIGHIKKVTEADTFLVEEQIDLSSIDPELLRETCSDRLIGSPGMSDEDLQTSLQDWLTLVEKEPMQRQRSSTKNTLHFNGNLARTALMCYYALQGTQDDGAASKLPLLLYRGKQAPAVDASTEDGENDVDTTKTSRLPNAFRFRGR